MNHRTRHPRRRPRGRAPEPERIARLERESAREAADPDHHLWRNGRLWWIAFTVYRGHQQERVRFSLGTDDVEEARVRRDTVFELYEQAHDCRIALRFAPRKRAEGRAARPGGREGVRR